MKRVVMKVYGRVQGVLFRHAARLRAEELGLTGGIRNETNGSVTVLAEGEEPALERFVGWCREGPPLARVDEVEVDWREATGEFQRFEIQ